MTIFACICILVTLYLLHYLLYLVIKELISTRNDYGGFMFVAFFVLLVLIIISFKYLILWTYPLIV
jgi:hypothetical protein